MSLRSPYQMFHSWQEQVYLLNKLREQHRGWGVIFLPLQKEGCLHWICCGSGIPGLKGLNVSVLCDDLDGGVGMGGGVYVYTWLILTNKHCRAITLQLKKVTQCSFLFSYFSHYSCLLLNVPHPCFGSQMKGKATIVTYFEGMRLQTGYLIFVRKPLTPRILTLLIRRF